MSWGDIFFGFRGRISRKTYWTGSIAVALIGLAFSAFLAYLATGNPIAPDVWERPEGKARLWMPVWLAYFALLAWPSAALALKRLHDRNRGPWLWYEYYAVSFLVSLLPARSEATGEVTDVAAAAVV